VAELHGISDKEQLLRKAQAGDREASDQLIRHYRLFVYRTVSAVCRRKMDWRNDDELSVGLAAMYEAIQTYRTDARISFEGYARLVIRNRLMDYYRQESRNRRHYSLEQLREMRQVDSAPAEVEQATQQYERAVLATEQREEILAYRERLKEYGLDLRAVAANCPKRSDARRRLIRAAETLAVHPDLREYFLQFRKIPLLELARRSGIHPKALERGRKYLVGVALILVDERFQTLREFIPTSRGREGSS